MNVLLLDKSQPEIAEALADCEVGVPKTLTVTVTPTSVSDTVLVAQVDAVEYSAPDGAESEPAPAPKGEVPYKPRAKKGSATAVEE
jgi:hypothetical protein